MVSSPAPAVWFVTMSRYRRPRIASTRRRGEQRRRKAVEGGDATRLPQNCSARTERRKTAVINGFPDALDLMLVCTEAGLSLEASFARVGKEVMRLHPLLAELFAAAVLEMRAGRSREDALRRMADRAQIDEIHGFTTLLIQSTNLGSSIGQTLRVYAAEMRESRRMRAEEKAHRLPVLLSIPLVTCMLPVMIGVLMLPAAIRVIRVIIPALG